MLDEKIKNKIKVAVEHEYGRIFKMKPIGLFLSVDKNEEPVLRILGDDNDELMMKDISLTTGFGIFLANQFIRGLNTGIDIKFDNFKQYYELVNNVNHFIIERGVEVDA